MIDNINTSTIIDIDDIFEGVDDVSLATLKRERMLTAYSEARKQLPASKGYSANDVMWRIFNVIKLKYSSPDGVTFYYFELALLCLKMSRLLISERRYEQSLKYDLTEFYLSSLPIKYDNGHASESEVKYRAVGSTRLRRFSEITKELNIKITKEYYRQAVKECGYGGPGYYFENLIDDVCRVVNNALASWEHGK